MICWVCPHLCWPLDTRRDNSALQGRTDRQPAPDGLQCSWKDSRKAIEVGADVAAAVSQPKKLHLLCKVDGLKVFLNLQTSTRPVFMRPLEVKLCVK